MPRSPEPLRLNREQEIMMAAPVKGDIIRTFLRSGPLSINDLGATMNRSPKGLYYHMRQLCAAGLAHVESQRTAGTRIEAVYDLTADRLIREHSNDPESRLAAHRSVRALLRRVEREFAAVAETGGASEVIRVTLRLDRSALQTLLTKLGEAVESGRRAADRDSAEVAVTILVSSERSPTAPTSSGQEG